MLSLSSLRQPGRWGLLRRADLERTLALLLAVSAIVSSVVTYALITGSPPYGASVRNVLLLLYLDLILLLLLGVVVARRLVRLILDRRQGSGSKLHTRLVALFSIVAVTPAILVAIFSVVFLSSGLETWFSSRIRAALDNSLSVAEAYLQEHRDVIRADALAMATDLEREGPALLQDPIYLRHFVVAQAALRSLTEAIVFDKSGRVLARSGLGIALEVEQLSPDALARAEQGEVVTMTNSSDDRVRALLRLDGMGEELFLFVGRFVDANVLNYMERTQRVVAEYRLMESERSGVQITSSLIFGVVALLLLLGAVWFGINFADQLATPIGRLIAAANRVRSGDLMARVPEDDADDEIALLSRAFNRMTSQLEGQRRELIAANQQLDDRRRFTEAVLAGVTAGVIGLDAGRRVVLPNRSAMDLLGIGGAVVADRPIEELLPELSPLFIRLADRPEDPVQEEVGVVRGGRRRILLVRLAAQLQDGEVLGFVLTFDDVTELMSAQRQAAWAEVARRIAHEIKNPLTPIRLSAERLNRKYLVQIREPDQESFTKSVTTIVRQVDTIGRLIGEFSAFARMPAPVMRQESVTELVRAAVHLQEEARPAIGFTLDLPPADPLLASCDGEKIGQVLTNLLQNAVDVLGERGAGDGAKPAIVIRARQSRSDILIEVEDNGPGLPAGERERLFEPYVTTRAHGTGLGLAIVKKIMEEHAGRVELTNGSSGGALVRLSLPAKVRA